MPRLPIDGKKQTDIIVMIAFHVVVPVTLLIGMMRAPMQHNTLMREEDFFLVLNFGMMKQDGKLKMSEPRAYTVEEVRDKFISHLQNLARYWANLPHKTPLERTEGMLHSVLVTLDG